MNPSTRQKQTHRRRDQTVVAKGEEGGAEGQTGSMGQADANYDIQNG